MALEERRKKDKSRFYLTILGIASSVLVNAGVIVWWAAKMDSTLANVTIDRSRELALRDERIKGVSQRMDVIERHFLSGLAEIKDSVNSLNVKIDRYILRNNSHEYGPTSHLKTDRTVFERNQ